MFFVAGVFMLGTNPTLPCGIVFLIAGGGIVLGWWLIGTTPIDKQEVHRASGPIQKRIDEGDSTTYLLIVDDITFAVSKALYQGLDEAQTYTLYYIHRTPRNWVEEAPNLISAEVQS